MTGAGAWRTSWRRAATRVASAGMPSPRTRSSRWRWWAVVGQYPPQQGQPPGLGQPLTGTGVEGGQGQFRHVVGGDGPGEEHPRGAFVVLGRLPVPGVEVGLGAVA